MENPTIVVVAYNRADSLKRLLTSLSKAKYPSNTRLIVSIDSGASLDVVNVVNTYKWQFGEKIVINQQKHLGLREHILKCGDLTQKYESIILLEDDLFVSPMFYDYASKALNFYSGDDRIAGISLYTQSYNMFTNFPFIPIVDDNDVFFLQIPASWGEAWNKEQWLKFKTWYESEKAYEVLISDLPPAAQLWPKTSWAKYFWMYMIQREKYFVYPRFSLTTQFGEVGVHSPKMSSAYQVPLQICKQEYKFEKFENSIAVYDPYYEIYPEKLNTITNKFNGYDSYTIDLNGIKEIKNMKTDLVLTSKRSKDPIMGFARELKPSEMNIIWGKHGDQFFFCNKESIAERFVSRLIRRYREYKYYNREITTRKLLVLLFLKIFKQI